MIKQSPDPPSRAGIGRRLKIAKARARIPTNAK
jgi:hypothetical protein